MTKPSNRAELRKKVTDAMTPVDEMDRPWVSGVDYMMRLIDEAIAASRPAPYQERVDAWLVACFGEQIARDKTERNHRFLEEALEAVQAGGCTRSEAHQLVDYVFDRPVGEPCEQAMRDAELFGIGYTRSHPDGTIERLPPEEIDPNDAMWRAQCESDGNAKAYVAHADGHSIQISHAEYESQKIAIASLSQLVTKYQDDALIAEIRADVAKARARLNGDIARYLQLRFIANERVTLFTGILIGVLVSGGIALIVWAWQ